MDQKFRAGLRFMAGYLPQFFSLWLRWYDRTGWIPTLAEKAEAERQRADQLAAYLRSQGIDPENLPI
jgi:hypothetical protein